MPPKAQANPKAQGQTNAIPLGLTARDAEIALVAWTCLEADNKINAEKLAGLTNINKPESASRMFRMIKGKIENALPNATGNGNGDGASVATDAAKPAKSAANKQKATAKGGKKRGKKDADTDDGASTDGSVEGGKPKKKTAKRVKKEQPEADADMEGVDGDAEAGVA